MAEYGVEGKHWPCTVGEFYVKGSIDLAWAEVKISDRAGRGGHANDRSDW